MKTLKKLLLEYSTIAVFFILAIIIELFGAQITDGGFYIKDPRYMFTILGALVCVLICIRNQRARLITASALLYIHLTINVVFILIFEMAGQYFDLSMLSLRGDAMGILENLPVNFWYTWPILFVITTYLILGLKYLDFLNPYLKKLADEIKEARGDKKLFAYANTITISTSGALIVLFIILNVMTGYAINGDVEIDKYDSLLHSNLDAPYQQYGTTNNFINEIYARNIFYNEKNLPGEEIEDYLYKNVYNGSDDYFGVSAGNNVITILGETFEWFSFVSNDTTFGNGEKINFVNGASITEENMRKIYPNLWRLYDEGYVLTNYHAREKTDISEAYSIMGSYPIGKFTHYDYPSNIKLQSMPNILRDCYESQGYTYSSQYFHDGYSDFYNRITAMPGFGFDTVKFSETMKNSSAFTDYGSGGERNFDSEMIEACADEMFPKTKDKFYTYITTITMHGLYQRQRDNLTAHKHQYGDKSLGCYDVLKEASNGKMNVSNCSPMELSLYTYMAAAMVTDEAIGKILNELSTRENSHGEKLIDNTTLVIFGDHQAYYEGLSNYVKKIYEADDVEDTNYMDLYRVPCLIYDKKLVNAVTNGGENKLGRFNNKFSSSCDIVPTLLDILGIKYYDGFYYGHSVLSDTETIVYSRGYGFFLDNYSYSRNINKFLYINPKVISLYNQGGTLSDEEAISAYKAHVDEIGTLLCENIKYVDNLYKTNLFKNKENYNTFKNKMFTLNGWSNVNNVLK